jgi:hypothetical protein
MTAFHEKSVTDRLEGLAGGPAEAAAAKVMEARGRRLERFGTPKSSTDGAMASSWPAFITHAPDFISFGALYEVQGCGEAMRFAFKHEKLEALRLWHTIMPVRFLLYIQPHETVIEATFAAIEKALADPRCEQDVFDEHLGVRAKKVTWVPVDALVEMEVADAFDFERAVQRQLYGQANGRYTTLTSSWLGAEAA